MRLKIILIVLSLLILASCSEKHSDPQEAFKAYQNAINANDYSAIKGVTSERFRLQMIEQGTDLRDISKYFKKAGLTRAYCKITFFEQVGPEKATIGCTGEYEYENGIVDSGYSEEYFSLIKEDGKSWKIDEYKGK